MAQYSIYTKMEDNNMKIKELVIGENVNVTLVVTSATARETKAKKPFLALELYDGTDTIFGNYWDWLGEKVPGKNSIVDIRAQVTEYMGVKQLNIKTMKLNTEKHLSEFSPVSAHDIGTIYKNAYASAIEIKDDLLRNLAVDILEQLRTKWLEVPGAKSVHHAFVGGTLVHCLSVANIAKSISANIPQSNDELCFVGGLLHDLGKLFTYRLDGITVEMTDAGMLYEHTFIGAEFIGNFAEGQLWYNEDAMEAKLEILRHIILSHHGLLEYGAAVPPLCVEAHVVSYADGVDASVQQVIEQSAKKGEVKWTDKIYTLSNRPHLNTHYVKAVFSEN